MHSPITVIEPERRPDLALTSATSAPGSPTASPAGSAIRTARRSSGNWRSGPEHTRERRYCYADAGAPHGGRTYATQQHHRGRGPSRRYADRNHGTGRRGTPRGGRHLVRERHRLHYVWNDEHGEIREQTYAEGVVHAEVGIGGSPVELAEYVLESLAGYINVYQDDPEACVRDWEHIYEMFRM